MGYNYYSAVALSKQNGIGQHSVVSHLMALKHFGNAFWCQMWHWMALCQTTWNGLHTDLKFAIKWPGQRILYKLMPNYMYAIFSVDCHSNLRVPHLIPADTKNDINWHYVFLDHFDFDKSMPFLGSISVLLSTVKMLCQWIQKYQSLVLTSNSIDFCYALQCNNWWQLWFRRTWTMPQNTI